jgi:antitoxin component YwqK of YwqJK toxin-antitoxin module
MKLKQEGKMNKKIAAVAAAILSVFAVSSCTVQIVDRPDYYRDYDDKAAGAYSYNYSSTSNYSSYVAPTPTPVIVVNFITLKVVENTYYFYAGGNEIAIWRFKQDGTVLRKGKTINGLVIRFYDGTNIEESEIQYKNGERWGLCKKFYPNGMLKEEINYYNGDRDGNYTVFHPNGKMMEQGRYKRGNRYGNYYKYVETGELQEKGLYENNAPRVTYFKATPVPTSIPVVQDNRSWQDKNKGGRYDKNSGYGEKTGITAVATRVPVAVVTQAVINQHVEATVAATAVAVATQVPVETQEKHNEAVLKQGWIEGSGEVKNAVKEDNKDIKQEINDNKEAVKDQIKQIRDEIKDTNNAAKDVINENKQEAKHIIKDAKGNTMQIPVTAKTRGKTPWAKSKEAVSADVENEGTTKEVNSDNKDESGTAKEGDNKETQFVKERENKQKQDDNGGPGDNGTRGK